MDLVRLIRTRHDRGAPRPGRTVSALAAVVLVTGLALTGCSGGGDAEGSRAAGADSAKRPAAEQDAGARPGASGAGGRNRTQAPLPAGLHIIRTAALSVRVKDTGEALDAARRAAEDAGGVVGDETTDRDENGGERSRVVLRVPQEHYQEVLDALAGTGTLITRSVKAEDVTDQVVDVDSRVKSQRASVDRVRRLMDRAAALSDVVSLEGELSTREADLESLLAQQASLKDRTGLATITLSLSERAPRHATAEAEGDPGFTDALAGGWHALVTVLGWLAVVLGALLPFAVPLALLALLWLRVVRPRLRKRAPAPGSAVGPPARTATGVPLSGTPGGARTPPEGPPPAE